MTDDWFYCVLAGSLLTRLTRVFSVFRGNCAENRAKALLWESTSSSSSALPVHFAAPPPSHHLSPHSSRLHPSNLPPFLSITTSASRQKNNNPAAAWREPLMSNLNARHVPAHQKAGCVCAPPPPCRGLQERSLVRLFIFYFIILTLVWI